MFGRETATVDPGWSKFWKEEEILRMPSLNFSLEVTSPEIPSTRAVCSGFLHSHTEKFCKLFNTPSQTLKQVECQGRCRKRTQAVRGCNNPFTKQNDVQAHLFSFTAKMDFALLWLGCLGQYCLGSKRTQAYL